MIGGFRSVWFVSVFEGSLLVIVLFWVIIDYSFFLIVLILVTCILCFVFAGQAG